MAWPTHINPHEAGPRISILTKQGFQTLTLLPLPNVLNDEVKGLTLETALEIVEMVAGSMVGYPILWIIIRPCLVTSRHGRHLVTSSGPLLLCSLDEMLVEQSGPEDLPGPLFILELGPGILHRHDNARRSVRQSHGRLYLVYILATLAAGTIEIYPGLTLELSWSKEGVVLGALHRRRRRRPLVRQDDKGDGRGMETARCLCLWHSLDPMHARLVPQRAIDARALDTGRGLSYARGLGRRRAQVENVKSPAFQLGIPLVHPEHLARKKTRLVSANAGPDLENGILIVEILLRKEDVLEPGDRRLPLRGKQGDLVPRQRPHLAILRRVLCDPQ